MEYLTHYFEKLSEHFDDIPTFRHMADRLHVRTGHIALGLVAFVFLFVVLGLGKELLTNLLGVVYPAYMSFKAIESHHIDDDKQWLTYWVVYGSFMVFDTVAEAILTSVPIYHPIKLLVLVYLAWPETKGAQNVYDYLIKPFLAKHQSHIDKELDRIKAKVHEIKTEADQKAADHADKSE